MSCCESLTPKGPPAPSLSLPTGLVSSLGLRSPPAASVLGPRHSSGREDNCHPPRRPPSLGKWDWVFHVSLPEGPAPRVGPPGKQCFVRDRRTRAPSPGLREGACVPEAVPALHPVSSECHWVLPGLSAPVPFTVNPELRPQFPFCSLLPREHVFLKSSNLNRCLPCIQPLSLPI